MSPIDLINKKPHAETLHGGINLMRNQVHGIYCIFRLRDCLQKILRECVTCARYRQCTSKQLMVNLKKYRVNASYPFINRQNPFINRIYYAGPYHLKCTKNRGQKT